MPGSSLSTPVIDDPLAELAGQPAIAELARRFAPLDLRLVDAAANPSPSLRESFDTWGEPPALMLGVPEGASPSEVAEALWQALLLAEGMPEPAEAAGAEARLRRDLISACARARTRNLGLPVDELVADDLRDLCATAGLGHQRGLPARGWTIVVPLGGEDRGRALAAIAHTDSDLAEAIGGILRVLPGAPQNPAQAREALDLLRALI